MLDAFFQDTDWRLGCSLRYVNRGTALKIFKGSGQFDSQLLAQLDRQLALGLSHFSPQLLQVGLHSLVLRILTQR